MLAWRFCDGEEANKSLAEYEVLINTSQEPLSTHTLKNFDNPFRVDDHKYSCDSKTVTVVVYDARDKECKQPRFIGEVPLQKINNMWEKEIEFKTCEVNQQFKKDKIQESHIPTKQQFGEKQLAPEQQQKDNSKGYTATHSRTYSWAEKHLEEKKNPKSFKSKSVQR